MGNLKTELLSNGDTTTYTYDNLNRLTDETVTVATSQDAASNVLAEYTYTLYDNGLRKTEVDRQRNSTSTTAFRHMLKACCEGIE